MQHYYCHDNGSFSTSNTEIATFCWFQFVLQLCSDHLYGNAPERRIGNETPSVFYGGRTHGPHIFHLLPPWATTSHLCLMSKLFASVWVGKSLVGKPTKNPAEHFLFLFSLKGELYPFHQHHPDPGPEAEVPRRGWQWPITVQVSNTACGNQSQKMSVCCSLFHQRCSKHSKSSLCGRTQISWFSRWISEF